MNRLIKIKERISIILYREEQKIQAEIENLRRTQSSNMSVYGIGGPYRRYEKAISKRQELLSELEALQKAQGKSVVLEPLHLYGYYCPTCSEKIYLSSRSPETVRCPLCDRRIYLDGIYTEWSVAKGSQYTRLRH